MKNYNLAAPGLVGENLADKGLIEGKLVPPLSFSDVIEVWILSSSTLPQPINISGVWVDAALWDDTAAYYD